MSIIKQTVHSLFGAVGLKVERLPKKGFVPTAKQYFNTGELSPLQENSLELYDAFYGDDKALEEYYIPNGYRLKFYETVVNFLKERNVDLNNKTIIDVGCGIGFLLSNIQKTYNTKKLSGSDFSQNAVDFSAKKFPNIEFFQQDLNDPIPGMYDVIFCTEVLEHLEKPYVAISNMLAALNEKGSLILTVPNGRTDNLIEHINFWSPESWKVYLERECTGCDVKTQLMPIVNNTINFALITKR